MNLFLARLYDSTGRCCCHSNVGVGVGVTLKFYVKDFLCYGQGTVR